LPQFSVLRYESVIHEFDPYFNYRSTVKLVQEGAYEFWNWFDSDSWYPLGRVIGGTVYPGIMFTAAAMYKILEKMSITVLLRDVCVFTGPFFAGNTVSAGGGTRQRPAQRAQHWQQPAPARQPPLSASGSHCSIHRPPTAAVMAPSLLAAVAHLPCPATSSSGSLPRPQWLVDPRLLPLKPAAKATCQPAQAANRSTHPCLAA
jgi:hypothetical protein